MIFLSSSSHNCSKVMMQFMEQQSNRSTTLDEKSAEDYLFEPCNGCLCDDPLQWWYKRGSNKYLRISVLAKEFLSICASSSHSERLYSTSRGIITFRRGRLAPDTISPLMTLKSWSREDATEDDKINLEVEDSTFVK